jgi:hypothetical protein
VKSSAIGVAVEEAAQKTRALIGLGMQADAQHQLSDFMAEQLMEMGAPPMNATLTTHHDVRTHSKALDIMFHGMMTAAEYAQMKTQMEKVLAAHPLLCHYQPAMKCERQEDGAVCLHAALPGMNGQDYEALIHALAEHQHAHDVHEDTTHSRHHGAHATHEKMVKAAANLNHMVEHALKDQPHAAFEVKATRCKGSKPGTYALNLRVAGMTDRSQAVPVMGALVAAFRRKRRRGGETYNGGHDDMHHHDDVGVSIDDFHIHIDNLGGHEFHDLVSRLAAPVLAIAASGSAHMGVVHSAHHVANVGQNGSMN